MSDKKKPSFGDINDKYSFLNEGVEGLENRHSGRVSSSKRDEPKRKKPNLDNRQQKKRKPNNNPRKPQNSNKDFRNMTIRMDPAAIEKERRRLYIKAKKEREAKRKRVRLISIGLTILALLLFIFGVRALLDKGNKDEVVKPKSTTVKTSDSTEMETLKGYILTSKATKIFETNSKTGTELGDVPAGTYLESYGTTGDFTKIVHNGTEGFINTADTNKVKDKNTFKVIKGILVVNDEFSLADDFEPGINSEAKSNFDIMVRKAKSDGMIIKVVSDYRSYGQQKNNAYKDGISSYGEYNNDDSEVLAGHSEHQSGLAFDVVGKDFDNKYSSYFSETEEYQWLVENAHKHGFILRYPLDKEDVTGRKAEPWHLRYVGTKVATEIYEKGITLEEYLGLKPITETKKETDETTDESEVNNTEENGNMDGPNSNEELESDNNINNENVNNDDNLGDSDLMENSGGSNLDDDYVVDGPDTN